MVMSEEREQLLNEIDRLRRFNNKLAEAAQAIASRVAAAMGTTVDRVQTVGHRDQPTPEKD